MKITNWIKIFGTPRKDKYSHREYDIVHNEVLVDNITAITYKLHHDIYLRLRKFISPQYKTWLLMRKKKAFNTILFRQNYDVIITKIDGTVIELFKNLEPGFISPHFKEAHKIYFCPVGTINFHNIKKNNIITLKWRLLKERRY